MRQKTLRKSLRKRTGGDRDNGWTIKTERPEEKFGDPLFYYTSHVVDKYVGSGGMRRAQQKIALRIIELMGLEVGSRVLDIGCGPGYTSEVYLNAGYNVVGLDVCPLMIEKARQKGLQVGEGDMRNVGDLFMGQRFDGIASVSALQWIKEPSEVRRVAEGAYTLLGPESPLVVQFYPKSESELRQTTKEFRRVGFRGNAIIENPQNSRSRMIYLDLRRGK